MRDDKLREWHIAAIVGGCALALYVATVLPDFGGPEDTPKFQFIGYVLGTAHPPGYPLYVLLTHAFVQLPVGTIAYRANLFSAVMAAFACGVAYIIARRIGAARWFSASSALALATGLSFWRSAVFAEVYSLAAAVVALTIAFLLAWGARPDPKRLLAAVGTFALGLGNHLTIVGLIPAGAWYILIRNRRAITLRLVAACIAAVLLGVCQYWFIVVRSRQGAPYLESRAVSLSELAGVVTAERFANERFAFGPRALFTQQIPAVASAIRDEMGIAGSVLMAIGLVGAIRQRNASATLVLGSAAGLLGMVVNLAGDIQGFITSVMVLLWPVAAVGGQTIVDSLPISPRATYARVIAAIAMAAIPIAGLAGNYRASDQSHRTEESQFVRAVFAHLPDRAGIVAENYWYAMTLNYLAFTGEKGFDRGIRQLDSWGPALRHATNEGRRVFAFAGAATFLGAEGLRFRRAPLAGVNVNQWIGGLPRRSLVVAASANTPLPIEALRIGRAHVPDVGQFHPYGAFAWVVGEDAAAIEVGDIKAEAAKTNVVATAGFKSAAIVLNGHTIADVDEGLALAIFTPAGELSRTFEFRAGDAMEVSPLGALYEFMGESACVDVTTDRWSDITPAISDGSWVAALDGYGAVTIETEFSGLDHIRARSATLMGDGAIRIINQSKNADGVVLLTILERPSFQRSLFRLSLDRVPLIARARLKRGGAAGSVKLCGDVPSPLFASGTTRAVLRPDFESEPYFGSGWSSPQKTDAGTARFTTGDISALLLPLDVTTNYRIIFNVEAAPGTRIAVLANGKEAATCQLAGHVPCDVRVERPLLRDGVNAISLVPSNTLTFRGAKIHRAP